jgi:hypothetical protein
MDRFFGVKSRFGFRVCHKIATIVNPGIIHLTSHLRGKLDSSSIYTGMPSLNQKENPRTECCTIKSCCDRCKSVSGYAKLLIEKLSRNYMQRNGMIPVATKEASEARLPTSTATHLNSPGFGCLVVARFLVRLDCCQAVRTGWGHITVNDVSLFIALAHRSASNPQMWQAA